MIFTKVSKQFVKERKKDFNLDVKNKITKLQVGFI